MFIKFLSLNKYESFSTSSILSKITIFIVAIDSRTELDRLHFLVKLKIRAEKTRHSSSITSFSVQTEVNFAIQLPTQLLAFPVNFQKTQQQLHGGHVPYQSPNSFSSGVYFSFKIVFFRKFSLNLRIERAKKTNTLVLLLL